MANAEPARLVDGTARIAGTKNFGKSSIDRVRSHTAVDVLRRIDDTTAARLGACATAVPGTVAAGLDALDREWDTDRVLEGEAASMGLLGLALGVLAHPRLPIRTAVEAEVSRGAAASGRGPRHEVDVRFGLADIDHSASARRSLSCQSVLHRCTAR